ncbi:hypothetical protein OHV81_03130 [Acinetobacter baumannii]|nr:hypothetical protein [Acinetobacter baumannii]
MSLIDNFGYDAVKGAGINYRNSGDPVTAEKFEIACLEYRRNHNIYEKGDWVIHEATSCIGDFIKYLDSPSEHCLIDFALSDAVSVPLEKIRHVTEQEKQNKALK